jgi:hypothetical protein
MLSESANWASPKKRMHQKGATVASLLEQVDATLHFGTNDKGRMANRSGEKILLQNGSGSV